SHTNLGWDDRFGGFSTHPLPDGTRIALRLADLTLAVLNQAGAADALALDGRRDADARAWLGRHIAARSLDPVGLDTPDPYEMPAHAIASGAAYGSAALKEFLAELAAWFANANAALEAIPSQVAGRKLDLPQVRCWPHHFDLDRLIALGGDRTIGAGFSPGDEFYDEPY